VEDPTIAHFRNNRTPMTIMISYTETELATTMTQITCKKHTSPVECCRVSKRRRLSKPTVRFAEEKNTVRVRAASSEDLNKAWLQQADYDMIRENNRSIILAVMKAGGNISTLDMNEACVRGLEQHICVYVFNGNPKRQREFSRNICNQYREQRKMGVSDPESLSLLSSILSRADQMKALKIASIDACN